MAFLSGGALALRSLCRSPAFSIVSLIVLGGGIAISTAAFSVVHTLVRQPLPFPGADRLVVIFERNLRLGLTEDVSYAAARDWQQHAHAFQNLAALCPETFHLTAAGEAQSVAGARISPEFFTVLGLRPLLGRTLRAEDAGAVLISERLWRRNFASDPYVLGRELSLDGAHVSIAGVIPRIDRGQFAGHDLWAPLPPPADPNARSLQVIARLLPGVGIEQARADLDAFSGREGWTAFVLPMAAGLAHVLVGYMLLAALVVLLFLIVCANVATLELARAAARHREIAIRLALGASRGNVVRLLLGEGLLLAAAAGALGFLVVVWVRHLLIATVPELAGIRIDAAVFLFAAVISVLAALVFGLAPALSVSRPDLVQALKSGSVAGGKAPGCRLRRALVVSEMTLAVMLLAALGTLAQSFVTLRRADPGFRTDRLLAATLALRGGRYDNVAFFRQLVERAAALPGVEAAAAASAVPLAESDRRAAIEAEARPGHSVPVRSTTITPGYFRVLGIPLRSGRPFSEQDDDSVIINQRLSGLLWPASDGVGRRLRIAGEPWRTVVAVAADTRQNLAWPVAPELFLPHSADPVPSLALLLRTRDHPAALIPALRATIRSLDPGLPLSSAQTMDEIVAGYLPGALIAGVAVFCAAALFLAALGLYGVVAYLGSQRTREIGIRVALGAAPGDIRFLVLRQGLRLAFVGGTLGLLAAIGLVRLLSSVLVGVGSASTLVLVPVAIVLAVTALAASYLPSRRAARVNPAAALRAE